MWIHLKKIVSQRSFIVSKMLFTVCYKKCCAHLQEPIMPMDPSSVHPDNVESGKSSTSL